jgi:protein TonB
MAAPPVAYPAPLRSFIGKAMGGEEDPARLWALAAVLTLCLHLLAAQWLRQPGEAPTEAKPLPPLEVALVAAEVPKPVAAPVPAPPPPPKKAEPPRPPPPKPPPPKPKPAPPKPKPPKPVAKQPVEPVRRPVEPREDAPEPRPAPPVAERRAASPPQRSASAAPPVEQSASAAPKAPTVAPLTQASFNAAYLHNPKPDYPSAARQRGWEGTVKLKVRVSASGQAEQVDIHQSSGYDLLDEAALEAVRQWRFVPAKRGDAPVASSVIVPLAFHLSR